MGKPTSEQLAKINRFTKTPLSADDVYVHSFRLLGTGYIPSRYLQFDRSLMDIYKANVNNGDVVQIADHTFGNTWVDKVTIPFGRFFEGEVVQDGEKYQLDGSMFMAKNARTYIQDFTTDDISQQIDAGILHDSSVSVTWGFSECSICHNDIRDYDQCRHYPGQQYVVNDQVVTCSVIAKPRPSNDNSMMIENSIVCAGAYPDAGVLSVKPPNREGQDGKTVTKLNSIADLKLVNKDAPVFCCLSSNSATFHIEGENTRDVSELHQIYHLMYSESELPEGWTMAKLTAKHKEVVKQLFDEGHDHLLQDALDGSLNESLKSKSTKGSDNTLELAELTKKVGELESTLATKESEYSVSLAAKDTEIAGLSAKVAELTPKAELGETYRNDIVENAIKAGVRDQGNDFDEETYREMFANLDVEKVKSFSEKWEQSAIAKLGVQQHSQTEELGLPGGAVQPAVDPTLYKV